MIDSTVTAIGEISAPYGKKVTLENVSYENDTRVLRINIREGNRFTVMDIDDQTASKWAAAMSEWADKAK